jgi:hypothetical protein
MSAEPKIPAARQKSKFNVAATIPRRSVRQAARSGFAGAGRQRGEFAGEGAAVSTIAPDFLQMLGERWHGRCILR